MKNIAQKLAIDFNKYQNLQFSDKQIIQNLLHSQIAKINFRFNPSKVNLPQGEVAVDAKQGLKRSATVQLAKEENVGEQLIKLTDKEAGSLRKKIKKMIDCEFGDSPATKKSSLDDISIDLDVPSPDPVIEKKRRGLILKSTVTKLLNDIWADNNDHVDAGINVSINYNQVSIYSNIPN